MSPVSWKWAVSDFLKMKIPHVCLWSPHVLPRPSKWDPNVTIAGYTFNDATTYLPPKSLENFLETDKPMLAISFGSADIPNLTRFMAMVFDVLEKTGAKAVVCLDRSKIRKVHSIPAHVFLVDDIPHGWLLPRVKGFMHHGGAGHTAVGLKFGIPMLIVPFFLDQNFWAAKVEQLQLGPPPLYYHTMTTQDLTTSLKDLLSPKYRQRCMEMASQISSDRDGAEVAAELISRVQSSAEANPRCSILTQLKAHWKHVESGLRLSDAAAACLTSHEILNWTDLDLEPSMDWPNQRSDASTKVVEMLTTFTDVLYHFIETFYAILRWFVGGGPWPDEYAEDDHAKKFRDPVRQARMKQGEYDLQFIKSHSNQTLEGGSTEDRIIKNFRILRTAEFHANLDEGYRKE